MSSGCVEVYVDEAPRESVAINLTQEERSLLHRVARVLNATAEVPFFFVDETQPIVDRSKDWINCSWLPCSNRLESPPRWLEVDMISPEGVLLKHEPDLYPNQWKSASEKGFFWRPDSCDEESWEPNKGDPQLANGILLDLITRDGCCMQDHPVFDCTWGDVGERTIVWWRLSKTSDNDGAESEADGCQPKALSN